MIKMLSPPMHVLFSARYDMSIAGKNDNEIKKYPHSTRFSCVACGCYSQLRTRENTWQSH